MGPSPQVGMTAFQILGEYSRERGALPCELHVSPPLNIHISSEALGHMCVCVHKTPCTPTSTVLMGAPQERIWSVHRANLPANERAPSCDVRLSLPLHLRLHADWLKSQLRLNHQRSVHLVAFSPVPAHRKLHAQYGGPHPYRVLVTADGREVKVHGRSSAPITTYNCEEASSRATTPAKEGQSVGCLRSLPPP